MPIEIKELHIRVMVTPSAAPAAAGGGAGGDAKEAIVAECVEQVMQILRNKTER